MDPPPPPSPLLSALIYEMMKVDAFAGDGEKIYFLSKIIKSESLLTFKLKLHLHVGTHMHTDSSTRILYQTEHL